MVNNAHIMQDKKEDRLSMRVVSVWTALNTTVDSNIANNAPTTAEQMEQIMPAAGDTENIEDGKD